jgi:hypothetical protein
LHKATKIAIRISSLAIVIVGFSAGVKKVLTSSAHRSRVIPETAGGYDVVETAGTAAGLS